MTIADGTGRRADKSPAPHDRSERVIHVDGQWFFNTREGLDFGPYATRADAELSAAELAGMLKRFTDPEITREFVIREFMLLRWAQRSARMARR